MIAEIAVIDLRLQLEPHAETLEHQPRGSPGRGSEGAEGGARAPSPPGDWGPRRLPVRLARV